MPVTFSIFQKRLYAVVIKTGSKSHMNGSDLNHTPARLLIEMEQSQTQQVVERVPEGASTRRALPSDTLVNVSSSVTVVLMLMM